MPRQVYRCPKHGEFEITIPVKEKVPEIRTCDKYTSGHNCTRQAKWVPSAPNFIGGPTTGAKKE